MSQREGILAAGNFIVDQVKVIDAWPEEQMLANIVSESSHNGGGPYNILKDLRALGVDYPLMAAGLVGDDPNGHWILEDCRAAGIDVSLLTAANTAPTSYTDAMTVATTGRRTFFHQRGANAFFSGESIEGEKSRARLFYLGYLMLLDELDTTDENGCSGAFHLLQRVRSAGMMTAIDLVSTEHRNYAAIVKSALPATDILFINELEASRVLGRSLPAGDVSALQDAAVALRDFGVQQEVVLHTEKGAVCASPGGVVWQASLDLPPGFSRGATGAGDAFAAGWLHGTHEGWTVEEKLRTAVCVAASNLRDPSASGGILSLSDCLGLAETFGYRS